MWQAVATPAYEEYQGVRLHREGASLFVELAALAVLQGTDRDFVLQQNAENMPTEAQMHDPLPFLVFVLLFSPIIPFLDLACQSSSGGLPWSLASSCPRQEAKRGTW